MKIRPRKFLSGGDFDLDAWINLNLNYFDWYKTIYPNALMLLGNPLKLRNDKWNKLQLSPSHYTTDDLRRSAYNNYLYTNDYDARHEDLTHWGELLSDFSTISDLDFVNRYNKLALTIRDAREAPLTYNRTGYTGTNRTFRDMFWNRSRQGTGTPLYTIGYQDNIEDIEGTSTWLRRMDRYEKPFNEDTPEGLRNRTFYITRPNGTKIKVYKKLNGDIGLFNDPNDPESPKEDPNNPIEPNPENPNPENPNPENPNDPYRLTPNHTENNGLLKGLNLNKYLPDLLGLGRLAGTIATNNRVYNQTLRGIKPGLQQSFLTYRQVVGDEATKQGYYRRAAQGQTKAAQPFTADADRQMAYLMEAKRIGDEMRAQGDLADNAEIRRTSDESNLHQWRNIERNTQVANSNMLELIKTYKLKQDLKAARDSANWTSIDGALRGLQARIAKENKRRELINDQIFALDSQYKLANDTTYQDLYDDVNSIFNDLKGLNKTIEEIRNDPDFKEAKRRLDDYQYLLKRRQYEDLLNRNSGYYFGKSGMKFTFKSKNDLLYKASRDAVDHFRKMVKMTNDATVRTLAKPIKLVSPPKMLQGGVAPFVIYTPLSLGEEESVLMSRSSDSGRSRESTSSGSGGKETTPLDIIKDLFKGVEGLPSDVNGVYSAMSEFLAKQSLFGGLLSTDDMSAMYLQQLQQINNIKFSKKAYDLAKEEAEKNKALQEFAVTSSGHLVVLDTKTGKLSYMTPKELIKGLKDGKPINPLRNEDVLNIRAWNRSFDDGLLNIVNSGIGMEKIAEFIKSQLPNIESSEKNIDGFTRQETEKIKNGLKILSDAPPGNYKYTIKDKSNKEQAAFALKYLLKILPVTMKSILEVHAQLEGSSMDEILTNLVSSNISEEYTLSANPMTDHDKDGSGKSGSSKERDNQKDVKSNPLSQMLQGQGGTPGSWEILTRDSNVKMSVSGVRYPQIPKVTDDTSIDKMLSESGISMMIDSKDGITFGDLHVKPELLKDIMYSNSGKNIVVTLPCKIVNGHKEVNLGVKESYEEAVKEVDSKGIKKDTNEYLIALGKALEKKGLTSLLDKYGYPDRSKFGQFLLVEAYATTKVKGLDPSSQYIEKVSDPDEELESRMIKALSNDKEKLEYSLDIDYWFWGDDVYRATMFIPLNNNLNASINAWGDQVKVEEARDIERRYDNFNKASTMKSSNSEMLSNETK